MVYQYDLALPLPTKDLYDTLIMQMALATAKDMYERGEKRIQDIYDKYGDFYSPIASDVDFVHNETVGKLQAAIDLMYANGEDPLRTAEGRAKIERLRRSIDTAAIAKKKIRAKNAEEYYKNQGLLRKAGLYNDAFSKFLGEDPSLWDEDFAGYTSPTEYRDLNQYTNHIFDALKDSYLGTDKDHYDWYGVTDKHLYESLTPDKIGGLLNTPLGKFHYLNAIKDLAVNGVTNPTEELAIELFKRNIIAANHEKVHLDRKINEIWKMQQEDASRMRAAAVRASRSGSNSDTQQNNQWSFAELVRRSGTTAILGKQVQEYSDNLVGQQRDRQIDFGIAVSKATGNHSFTSRGIEMYKQQYCQNIYRKKDIIDYFRNMGYLTTKDGGSIIIPKSDLKKLSLLKTLISRTTGFRNKKVETPTKDLKDADVVIFTPTEGSYQAFMKNSRNESHFEGTVTTYNYKTVTKKDSKGNEVAEKVLDKDSAKTQTLYIDSDIKSIKNDPRLGYLTGPKGQNIINTQDTRYQNAIHADKETTDKIIKGTIYGSDAILSEELGYAQ